MIRASVVAWSAAGLLCLAAQGAERLGAQEPGLDTVASLSAEGRVSEARGALQSWWDARWPEASDRERQRALWLRGNLAVDPSAARRDYTRLALEHPGGRHSADALLRLAQGEDVAGRVTTAARHYQQLLREYPDSPHRLEARRWLDEHREEVARAREEGRARAEERTAAEPAPEEAPAAPDEEELAPDEASAAPAEEEPAREEEPAAPDEERADAADEEEPAAEETGGGGGGTVSVQLGAFSSVERARTFVRSARDEGITGLRLVRVQGSDLIRVRAGRFPSRESASSLRSRIEERGFSTAVVTDADQESPVP